VVKWQLVSKTILVSITTYAKIEISTNIHTLIGKIDCHIKLIKISYRTRGKQLRINRITPKIKILIKLILLIITKLVIIAITASIPYSLKNNKTKIDLPISKLKPLISSLSPSKRSKGARFLSIKEIISHVQAQRIKTSKLTNILLKKKSFEEP